MFREPIRRSEPMRYASAISWIGGLVASLALLATAVAAICGRRVHRIPADLRLPSLLNAGARRLMPAPIRAPATGLRGVPEQRHR